MFANSDFNDLLRIFNANSVKYLVIGGYALIQYTEPRFTKDLDLLIGTDISNASAVLKALREFGAPLSGMTEDDLAEEGYFYQTPTHSNAAAPAPRTDKIPQRAANQQY